MAKSQTTEKAFETYVMQMLVAKGWRQGAVAEWDQALVKELASRACCTS